MVMGECSFGSRLPCGRRRAKGAPAQPPAERLGKEAPSRCPVGPPAGAHHRLTANPSVRSSLLVGRVNRAGRREEFAHILTSPLCPRLRGWLGQWPLQLESTCVFSCERGEDWTQSRMGVTKPSLTEQVHTALRRQEGGRGDCREEGSQAEAGPGPLPSRLGMKGGGWGQEISIPHTPSQP